MGFNSAFKGLNKSETFVYKCIGFFCRSMQRIAYNSEAPQAVKATNQSEAADLMAQSALNSIDDILHELPKQVDQAHKLRRDVEDTNKVTSQVATFLNQNLKQFFLCQNDYLTTLAETERKKLGSHKFL